MKSLSFETLRHANLKPVTRAEFRQLRRSVAKVLRIQMKWLDRLDREVASLSRRVKKK